MFGKPNICRYTGWLSGLGTLLFGMLGGDDVVISELDGLSSSFVCMRHCSV